MKKVRIQKRSKRLVTLGALLAANALLSAFQPAAAQVLVHETGRASTQFFVRGDIEISLSAMENGAYLCAWIRNIATGAPSRTSCVGGADVEVSDTLESAWGRGTTEWSTYEEGKGRGGKAGGTYKYGTTTIDVTWTGVGETLTKADYYEACWVGFLGDCWVEGRPQPYAYQYRAATLTGTITDSQWGTFVIDGATGHLTQPIL